MPRPVHSPEGYGRTLPRSWTTEKRRLWVEANDWRLAILHSRPAHRRELAPAVRLLRDKKPGALPFLLALLRHLRITSAEDRRKRRAGNRYWSVHLRWGRQYYRHVSRLGVNEIVFMARTCAGGSNDVDEAYAVRNLDGHGQPIKGTAPKWLTGWDPEADFNPIQSSKKPGPVPDSKRPPKRRSVEEVRERIEKYRKSFVDKVVADLLALRRTPRRATLAQGKRFHWLLEPPWKEVLGDPAFRTAVRLVGTIRLVRTRRQTPRDEVEDLRLQLRQLTKSELETILVKLWRVELDRRLESLPLRDGEQGQLPELKQSLLANGTKLVQGATNPQGLSNKSTRK